ncbi:MAG: peptide ABC transporter substrate-binding protein [Kosmotogaceae bacterium]
MLKRKVLVALVATLVLLGSFAFAVKQEITYNLASEANAYDPRSSAGLNQRQVINQVFEGLLKTDMNGALVPGIAESWDMLDNGTRIIFHLRDAKWSDGKPVTAHDFEYAWKSQLDPDFASASNERLFILRNAEKYNKGEAKVDEVGVKALDDRTLEVRLEYASPFSLENFAGVSFYPVRKDIAEKDPEGWTINPRTFIGNGPFKMVEWRAKDYMTFEKNPNYYDADSVKLSTLRYVFVEEATTAHAAFLTGEIDVNETVPAFATEQLIKDGYALIVPLVATYYYSINMGGDEWADLKEPRTPADETVRKVLWDKNVRHALSLAIDRVAITDVVLRGGQVPAYGFAPEGVVINGEDFRMGKSYFDPRGDVAEAQRLLAEAGYPGGQGFPVFEIFYNTSEMHAAIAQAVQDMWRKNLGITVRLVNKETNVFAHERGKGQYQIARSGNTCDTLYPSILGLFKFGIATNDPQWVNPEYVALIDAAERSTDVARMAALYRMAEDVLMEEMPVIPVFYYTRVFAMQKDIHDVVRLPSGSIFFKWAYRE